MNRNNIIALALLLSASCDERSGSDEEECPDLNYDDTRESVAVDLTQCVEQQCPEWRDRDSNYRFGCVDGCMVLLEVGSCMPDDDDVLAVQVMVHDLLCPLVEPTPEGCIG